MTEKQLISLACIGNVEAFEVLFNRYRPIVYTLEKRYYLKDLDHDDWLQEGRIVFFQVLLRYDPKRGASLGKFYKLAFNNHIMSLLRKQNALKRRTDILCDSLEALNQKECYYDQRDKTPLPEDYIILREQLVDYEMIFSDFERKVIGNFLLGFKLEEQSEALEIPEKKIRAAYDRAKRKLSQYLHDCAREC